MDLDLDILHAHFASIVESSQDAILAKDLAGTVTAWNPAAERLFGYAAEEIIGRSVNTIVPAEMTEESEHILAEVLAGRSVPPHDTERISKAGNRLAVSVAVSPIRDASGAVIGASSIARNISERLAVDADRAWAEMLFRQSPEGILALDGRGRITTWNPAAERLFGYSRDEAVGRLPQEVIASEGPRDETEDYEPVLSSGRPRRYEAKRRHRDGHELTVEISISPLIDPDGQQGAVVSIRDVTEARAAQTSIRDGEARETQLTQELDQTRRLESVGQLAGGIAHDFNNLLGVVLNLAAFVAEALPQGSQARTDAEEIELAAKRAAALTRQLLIFSRRAVIAPQVFNAGELITGLESFLRRALGGEMLLEVFADDDLWMVQMDRGQLEQVVVNLAINARDAMPTGGRLIIELRNTAVDAEFASTRTALTPGNYVSLTVTDTGTGMEPDVIEHAFDPYYTTKPEGQGTGLGLATVYGIVTKASGSVALYSEPGQGTTVRIHLPALSIAASHTPPPAPFRPGAGEHILVVEDAPDVRNVARRILETGGYEVTTAHSAAKALALVNEGATVDLVLTDVVMPSMTGPELATQLRTVTATVKVVFMSGYSHKLLTDEVLTHPQSAFIEKPFTADQLRAKVRQLLDRDEPTNS